MHSCIVTIDKWSAAKRNLEAIKDEYQLATPFLFVALEGIMNVDRAKDHYEAQRVKCDDFDVLLAQCKEYTTKRPLEHNRKGNDDHIVVDNV